MQWQDLWYPVPRLQRPAALVDCFCCCCDWLRFCFAYYDLQHPMLPLRMCCNNPWCPQTRRNWVAFFARGSQDVRRHLPTVGSNFLALYNNQAARATAAAAEGAVAANRLTRDGIVPGEYGLLAGEHQNAPHPVNKGAGPSSNSNAQRRSKRGLGRDRKSSPYYKCNQYCKNCTNVPVHTERVTPQVANIWSQPPHHASLPSSAFFKPIRSNIPLERSALAAPQRSVSPIKVPAIRACQQKLPDGTIRPPCGNHFEKYCHASYDNYITF